MIARAAALCSCWLAVVGCAEIETFDFGECGNNVVDVEEGEDCDLVADPALGDDLQCGPPDGGAQECRYVCDGAECPRGWACEDDGICRAPSGAFENDGDPIAVIKAVDLVVADIAGTEEAEIVARLEGDLFVLGDSETGYVERFGLSVPDPRGDLFVADVDGDDLLDVIVPGASWALDTAASPRVHALRSDGTRLATAVVPQTYVEPRIVGAAALPTGVGAGEVVLRVLEGDAGGLLARVEAPTCTRTPAASSVAIEGSAELVPPPAVGVPFADARPHAAIAVPGRDRVTVVRGQWSCGANVCQPALTVAPPCVMRLDVAQVVSMPAPVTAGGCTLVDGDLVCEIEGDRLAVAPNDGTAFGPGELANARFDVLADHPPTISTACAPSRRILAAGDLDDDDIDDLVTPHGIFVADGDSWRRAFSRTFGDGWGDAVIGDFDRDGRPEVVANALQAGSGCEPVRLQYLVETSGAWSELPVRAASLPDHLRSSDFDGDGTDDLAAVERAADGVVVSVFYGDTRRALQDKVSVGDFSDVSQLVALRSREGTEVNDEQLGDLAIVTEHGEFVTAVTGTAQRSLLSGLTLHAEGALLGRTLVSSIAGSLGPRDGPTAPEGYPWPPDILTIAGPHAWLLRDDDVHHGDGPHAFPVGALPLRTECATWSVGTARPTGSSLIAGVDGHRPHVDQVQHGCDVQGPAPTIAVIRIEGTRGAPQLRVATAVVSGAARDPTRVEVFDFDGSGSDDVLVHFAGGGVLTWLRDPDPASTLTPEPLLPDRSVLAIAAINADRDDGLELAALTVDGLLIVDAVPTLTVSAPVFETPRIPEPDEVVLLRAGDLDGNDLGDLALLLGESLFVYPAIPVE